jgi:hypothetical protein
MKFLFCVTLVFIICHVYYGKSQSFSGRCLANSLKSNLTTTCNDAFCDKKNIKDYNNCIANNCDKNHCDKIDLVNGIKEYCYSVWGAYCCGTKFFARECSQSDRQVYEKSIEGDAQSIESNNCSKYPRISFDCKEVDFGK